MTIRQQQQRQRQQQQQPTSAQRETHAWAHKLISSEAATERGRWCVLDTETTGLDGADEIIDLAIVDGETRDLVLRLFLQPAQAQVSSGALAVHGITPAWLRERGALGFLLAWPQIHTRLSQYGRVVTYNAPFDRRLLVQSARAAGLRLLIGTEAESMARDQIALETAGLLRKTPAITLHQDWICAMQWYAHGYGRRGRGWVRLEEALTAQNVPIPNASDSEEEASYSHHLHSAVTDALATHSLVIHLATLHTTTTTETGKEN